MPHPQHFVWNVLNFYERKELSKVVLILFWDSMNFSPVMRAKIQ